MQAQQEAFGKAQNGEDRLLAAKFSGVHCGVCVEVGAFDGIEMSNTYYFERQGWRCILVEASPGMAQRCRQNRPQSTVVECAVVGPGSPATVDFEIAEDVEGMSSIALSSYNQRRIAGAHQVVRTRKVSVATRVLDDILVENDVRELHFLSIDVEGFERSVLRGLQLEKWKPQIVLVERLGVFLDPWMALYFWKRGYEPTLRTGDNDWFERRGNGRAFLVGILLKHYVMAAPGLLPALVLSRAKTAAYSLGIYQWMRRMVG